MGELELVIANKNYSSWSLRAWLYLKASGVPFKETRVPLYTEEWDSRIGEYSPSGKLPVLVDGGLKVWDSLAIIAHVLESRPGAVGWPRETEARAVARSVSAEMHSGFMALRSAMPMNCRAEIKGFVPPSEAAEDADRVKQIWEECRVRFGADRPWLFGEISVADVMFAPVALRFKTYGVEVSGRARDYYDAVLAMDHVRAWVDAAIAEKEVIKDYEQG